MRISFSEVLELISTKTGIRKKDITFVADFPAVNVDVGKNCPDWIAKQECLNDFKKCISRGLYVGVKAKGYEVLGFYAQDIKPRTNDIYEVMRVSYTCSCIGPGFYQYSPYLVLDQNCDKKDIRKFVESLSFDPNKVEVKFYQNCRKCEISPEHREFLKTLPPKAVTKFFFKEIKQDKLTQANVIKKTSATPVM